MGFHLSLLFRAQLYCLWVSLASQCHMGWWHCPSKAFATLLFLPLFLLDLLQLGLSLCSLLLTSLLLPLFMTLHLLFFL